MRSGVEIGKMKKMAAKSARWGGDREDYEEDGGEEGEVGGDREDEEEDGGEECDVG